MRNLPAIFSDGKTGDISPRATQSGIRPHYYGYDDGCAILFASEARTSSPLQKDYAFPPVLL
jgi:hypothetical protein